MAITRTPKIGNYLGPILDKNETKLILEPSTLTLTYLSSILGELAADLWDYGF